MSRRNPIFRISMVCAAASMLCGCYETIDSSEFPDYLASPAISTEPIQTTVTSTTEPLPAPKSYTIPDVAFTTQKGLLPTGCELVSSLMLLRYLNFDITIDDVVAHTRAKYPDTVDGIVCAPHPSEAFIGSPSDPTSFGCFPPVIQNMLESIVSDQYEVIDTTGTDLQTLVETYIPQNIPVLVWATGNMEESYRQIGWYLTDENGKPSDNWYVWPAREHCLLLIGYDEENYIFNDPMQESAPTLYERKLVEKRNKELDRMSVVVRPKTDTETTKSDATD